MTNSQAKNRQVLPTNLQVFLNNSSWWEHHVMSDFQTVTLTNGRVKHFTGAVWLGSDHEPQDLLSLVYLFLDDNIPPHGGGKVEFEYNELQEVDT
jgi:hypothetical protein